jgi:hypothetical protein
MAKRSLLLIPAIFRPVSSGRSLLRMSPAMENMRLISMPTPTRMRNAVPVGTVQRAWPEKCWIRAFTISTNQ